MGILSARAAGVVLCTWVVVASCWANDGEAAKFYKSLDAAGNGEVSAMYDLWNRYQNGIGVARDSKEAMEWLARAAAAGYQPAIYDTAQNFRIGRNVRIDEAKAAQLYQQLADNGHVDAMYWLADAYQKGASGQPPDPAAAKKWFTAAAKGGHAWAIAKLKTEDPAAFEALSALEKDGKGNVTTLSEARRRRNLLIGSSPMPVDQLIKALPLDVQVTTSYPRNLSGDYPKLGDFEDMVKARMKKLGLPLYENRGDRAILHLNVDVDAISSSAGGRVVETVQILEVEARIIHRGYVLLPTGQVVPVVAIPARYTITSIRPQFRAHNFEQLVELAIDQLVAESGRMPEGGPSPRFWPQRFGADWSRSDVSLLRFSQRWLQAELRHDRAHLAGLATMIDGDDKLPKDDPMRGMPNWAQPWANVSGNALSEIQSVFAIHTDLPNFAEVGPGIARQLKDRDAETMNSELKSTLQKASVATEWDTGKGLRLCYRVRFAGPMTGYQQRRTWSIHHDLSFLHYEILYPLGDAYVRAPGLVYHETFTSHATAADFADVTRKGMQRAVRQLDEAVKSNHLWKDRGNRTHLQN